MTHRLDITEASGTAPAPLLRAGIAGLTVALWYAAPDYLHRKGLRAAAKTAVLGGAAVVLAWGPARSSTPVAPDGEESTTKQPAQGAPAWSGTGDRWRNTTPALVFGVGGTLLVAGIGLNIAIERWIHRWGNRLARQGTLLPHTAIGLVAGSLTVLAGLDDSLARQPDDRPAGSD